MAAGQVSLAPDVNTLALRTAIRWDVTLMGIAFLAASKGSMDHTVTKPVLSIARTLNVTSILVPV